MQHSQPKNAVTVMKKQKGEVREGSLDPVPEIPICRVRENIVSKNLTETTEQKLDFRGKKNQIEKELLVPIDIAKANEPSKG